MAKRILVTLLAAPPALAACHSSDDTSVFSPPTSVTKVASGGFTAPTDAVASPDGSTFYFAAFDDQKAPAIFATSSAPGSAASVLASGEPLEMPIGLVLSCDGATLYIADMGGTDDGGILTLAASGGTAAPLGVTGVLRPGGLAMGPDCETLYATGRTTEGVPAVFAIAGGTARVIHEGAPLVAPTGLHVDADGVAWVMDHRAAGENGEGVLFAIPSDGGGAKEVISDLRMGTPGGVSLTSGGGTAVMPTRDRDGNAQLTSVHIATGEMTQLAAPDMTDPAGLRTARGAAVFAVVDSEAGAIYRAE